jgi:zinc finger-containing ubiquitin peptidase 1
MMASYINGVESQGYQHFGGKLPTIFQIQDFIEHAWDLGINAQGRLETGGIRGTRKYIGTPEVSRERGIDTHMLTGKRHRLC